MSLAEIRGVIAENAGFSAPGQTIKNYTGNVASSATVATTIALETVTTGKTYVITDIIVGSNNGSVFEVRIQANGVDIFRTYCKGDTAPINIAGLESQPNASGGQAVTLVISTVVGAPNVAFYVGGFEF